MAMLLALMLLVLTLARATDVQIDKNATSHRFQAFCNYACHEPGCPDPAHFGIAPCARTSTGGCNGSVPHGCWSQGRFPMLNEDGSIKSNGGIPQRANLSLHLAALTSGIDRFMPEADWDGNAVLDFEAWTPIFEENTGSSTWHGRVYQQVSIAWVRERHPSWTNETQIRQQAKLEFESSGLHFFVATLAHLRQLRPRAKWGFYGLPAGHYGSGCGETQSGVRCGYASPTKGAVYRAQNDAMATLWSASVALYPSVYLPPGQGAVWQERVRLYVNDTTTEAVRLAQAFGQQQREVRACDAMQVIPFTWAMYHNGTTFLTPHDIQMTIENSYHPPHATQLIIWGSGRPQRADELPNFIEMVEGPIYKEAQRLADSCAEHYCAGEGWCSAPFSNTSQTCIPG